MRIAAISLAISALLALPAAANTFDWNQSAQGSVSGQASGSSMTRTLPNGYALVGIQLREHQDDPIYIQILGKELCADSGSCPTRVRNSEFFMRSGREGNIGSTKNLSVGHNQFVTGIQVCMNDRGGQNAKIKGLRFWAGVLNNAGSVSSSGGSAVEVKRTNCRSWSNRVNCPSGQVVVGLRAYYTSQSGNNALAPICAAPVATPSGGGSGGGLTIVPRSN